MGDEIKADPYDMAILKAHQDGEAKGRREAFEEAAAWHKQQAERIARDLGFEFAQEEHAHYQSEKHFRALAEGGGDA